MTPLSRNERRILEVLKDGPATVLEIVERAWIARPNVRALLVALAEPELGAEHGPELPGKGLIRPVAGDPDRWELAEDREPEEPVLIPEVGKTYVGNHDETKESVTVKDSRKRLLKVTEVVEGDHLGREVRGEIWAPDEVYLNGARRPYSTDLRTFRKVWAPAE